MENIIFGENLFFVNDACSFPMENKSAMEFFRQRTLGKTCVVSDTLYFELKTKHPRLKRDYVVLTKDESLKIENVKVCFDSTSLFDALSNVKSEDIVVIGGNSLTEKLSSFCNVAVVANFDENREQGFQANRSHTRWIKIGATRRKKSAAHSEDVFYNINVLPIWSLKFFDALNDEYRERNIQADIERKRQEEFIRMKNVLSSKKIKKVLVIKRSGENTKTVATKNDASTIYTKSNNGEASFSETSGTASKAARKVDYKNMFKKQNESKSTETNDLYNKQKMESIMNRVK